MRRLHGRCLCGAVRFSIPRPSRFDVCHCEDRRRWHGASPIGVDGAYVELTGSAPTLTWYRGSEHAERGFCARCGSSLFFRYTPEGARWSVFLGSLTQVPPAIPVVRQHFRSQKPAQYDVVATEPGATS